MTFYITPERRCELARHILAVRDVVTDRDQQSIMLMVVKDVLQTTDNYGQTTNKFHVVSGQTVIETPKRQTTINNIIEEFYND